MTLRPRWMWPAARLREAVAALARCRSDAPLPTEHTDQPPRSDPHALTAWLNRLVGTHELNLELDPFDCSVADFPSAVLAAAPALLRLEDENEVHFVAVLAAEGTSRVRLALPDGAEQVVPVDVIASVVLSLDPSLKGQVVCAERATERAGLRGARGRAGAQDILRYVCMRNERPGESGSRGSSTLRDVGWTLQDAPLGSFARLARAHGILRRVAVAALLSVATQVLWVWSWWLLVRGALSGTLEAGWLFGWAIVLLATVPLNACGRWLRGRITVDFGTLVKRRVMLGATRLNSAETAGEGTGAIVARVMESAHLEGQALTGALQTIVATGELAVAAGVLAAGTNGGLLLLVLLATLAVGAVMTFRLHRAFRGWTTHRLSLTANLVQLMFGHRTRLVQGRRDQRHGAEDTLLSTHASRARLLDRASAVLSVGIPRGWAVASLLALGASVVDLSNDRTGLAVALGGVLLVRSALEKLAQGARSVIAARVSWSQIRPLWNAASRSPGHGTAGGSRRAGGRGARLEVRSVSFAYAGRSTVLENVEFDVEPGDQVLLTGHSGSGKSTLAAIVAGLKQPTQGVVLLDGLDINTVGGEAWRKRVVFVPQFQENLLFARPLAFNLLMGRRWPPLQEDLRLAEQVCRELGLAELLERMPCGIWQMVGDHGWQLSHGERSRIFLARGLLQNPDILIVDEGFGTLDPETQTLALASARRHAKALIAISHR